MCVCRCVWVCVGVGVGSELIAYANCRRLVSHYIINNSMKMCMSIKRMQEASRCTLDIYTLLYVYINIYIFMYKICISKRFDGQLYSDCSEILKDFFKKPASVFI